MELLRLSIGALYYLLILGLCTFLLIRGITHTFVGLFACGAFLQAVQMLGFVYLREAPGGWSANAHYFPLLSAVATFAMLIFAAGFVSLTFFLVRNKTP